MKDMARLNEKTPNILDREMNIDRKSLRSNDRALIKQGEKELKKVKKLEKEKLTSGKFEWVTITPAIGKPYKTLRKVKI